MLERHLCLAASVIQDAYFELDNIANKVITLNKYKAALYD